MYEIIEQFVDHQIGFANDDRVGMLERLLRDETRIHAAHPVSSFVVSPMIS
jgi:hypothetical protein